MIVKATVACFTLGLQQGEFCGLNQQDACACFWVKISPIEFSERSVKVITWLAAHSEEENERCSRWKWLTEVLYNIGALGCNPITALHSSLASTLWTCRKLVTMIRLNFKRTHKTREKESATVSFRYAKLSHCPSTLRSVVNKKLTSRGLIEYASAIYLKLYIGLHLVGSPIDYGSQHA